MIANILKTALFPSRPAHLILHVTERCNLRCRTCFVDFSKYRGDEITVEEADRLSRYLGKLIWLDISGGEPFLRKDLPDVCARFDTESITIPTNGFNPSLISEITEQIRHRTSAELTIILSIDGFEETNDRIRQKGCYKKSIETLRLLKDVKGIRIKINTVLCEENSHEIVDFMKFVRREFDVDFHSIIFLRGTPADHTFKSPDYVKLVELREAIFNIWDTYDYGFETITGKVLKSYQRLMYDTSLRVMKEKRQIPRCQAWKHHLVVYSNGDIAFCEMLPPFGNIREAELDVLFRSEKAERQRRSIKQRECYCHHNCNMVDNFFLNPLHYPKLLAGIWR